MNFHPPHEQAILALSPLELQAAFQIVLMPAAGGGYFESTYTLGGMPIGTASLGIERELQMIVWYDFYPLLCVPRLERKKNIGTLAHTATMVLLVPTASIDCSFSVQHDPALTEGRKVQLRRMGINPEGEMIETYLEKSIQYAQQKGFTFTTTL